MNGTTGGEVMDQIMAKGNQADRKMFLAIRAMGLEPGMREALEIFLGAQVLLRLALLQVLDGLVNNPIGSPTYAHALNEAKGILKDDRGRK